MLTTAEIQKLQAQNEYLQGRNEYLEELAAKLQADEAMRRREWDEQSQYKAMLDMVLEHAPIVVWAVDGSGKVTRSLGRGLSTLGFKPGQVTGQDLFQMYREYPHVLQSVRRALAGEEFSETLQVGEVLFDCHYLPKRNSENDVVAVWGVAVVVSDRELSQRLVDTGRQKALAVSERRQADLEAQLEQAQVDVQKITALLQEQIRSRHDAIEKLDKAQRTFDSLMRCVPDYVLTLDGSGMILYLNRAPAGRTEDEVAGTSVFDWLDPTLHSDVRLIMDAVFREGHVISREVTTSCADQPTRFACRVGPVWWRSSVVALIVVATDVTRPHQAAELAQRRRIEFEQLAQITSLGQMAAIMAHKINNPLAAIANYVQGCIRRLRAAKADGTALDDIEPGLVDALQEVAGQANQASSCIRRLRAVLQKRETTYDRVDPMEFVYNSIEMTKAVARAQGVDLHVSAEPRLPIVMADVLQIEQVLMQLLLNAIDASASRKTGPREVRVHVRAGERGTVVFSVADTGPGLSDAFRDQVFEPFFTTKSQSVGMGLAVSRSVVEAHGGRLWIGDAADTEDHAMQDDTTVDAASGAVFYFTLPGRAEGATHD